MEEYTNFPKKNRLRALAFLEVGLFEIVFVGIILFLIFGTLNYFNILPVSEALPKQFGWLPRQQVNNRTNLASQGEVLQSYGKIPPQSLLPSPTQTISIEKNAQQLLSAVVSKNLQSVVLAPNNIYPVNPSTYEKGAFDYTWITDNNTVSGYFKLSSDSKKLQYFNLNIVSPQETMPSAESSTKIADKFFSISPQDTWKCKTVNAVASCENFWTDQDEVKKGISISGPIIVKDNEKVMSLSFCEFYKDSAFYENKSCLR